MADQVQLEATTDGVYLPVRAQPGARCSAVRGVQDGALKVSVTQVAEKGKANKALLGVLAKALGLRKSQLELVAGVAAAQKRFLVRDVTIEQLAARISAAVAQTD
jgi:uncharacterized protein YggU (UPF0235/DUF167 family)